MPTYVILNFCLSVIPAPPTISGHEYFSRDIVASRFSAAQTRAHISKTKTPETRSNTSKHTARPAAPSSSRPANRQSPPSRRADPKRKEPLQRTLSLPCNQSR